MLGGMMLLLALAVLAYGAIRELLWRRRYAAPFKRTGEIALNPALADGRGRISTEGTVCPTRTLFSPLTRRACLYYELEVRRAGPGGRRGAPVKVLREGTLFGLDDGTGRLRVDAGRGAVVSELDITAERPHGGGPLTLGGGVLQLPAGEGPYLLIERMLPAEGSLYALGQLQRGRLQASDKQPLMLSRRGRLQLWGEAFARSRPSLVGGALAAAAALPLLLLHPAQAAATHCPPRIEGTVNACVGQLAGEATDFRWQVARAGTYAVRVSTPPGASLEPVVALVDPRGNVVLERGATGPAKLTRRLEPGEYRLRVRDLAPGAALAGKSFSLEVLSAPPSPVATAEEDGQPLLLPGSGAGAPP